MVILKFTEWLNLNLLELKDKINIKKFNENFKVVDSAIHQIEDNGVFGVADEYSLGGVKGVYRYSRYTEPVAVDDDGYMYVEPYELLAADEYSLGGIKADAKTYSQTKPVGIGSDNKLYVEPDEYSLPKANSSTLGGVKAQSKTTEQTQAVGVDSYGNLYVKDLEVAEAAKLGGIKADPKTEQQTKPVGIGSDNKLYVEDTLSKTYVVSIPVSSWTEKTATMTVSGLKSAGMVYSVAPDPASYVNYSKAMVWADDITVDGQITFHCNKVPTSEISVTILETKVG